MLTVFANIFSQNQVEYSLFSPKEEREIKRQLDIAKIDRTEDFRQQEIIEIKAQKLEIINSNYTRVLIKTSKRQVQLNNAGGAILQRKVDAVNKIIEINQKAQEREAKNLAKRQEATAIALKIAIQQRRRQLAAG